MVSDFDLDVCFSLLFFPRIIIGNANTICMLYVNKRKNDVLHMRFNPVSYSVIKTKAGSFPAATPVIMIYSLKVYV